MLLSTNDMHAKIQNFPRLVAAVENCRDTAQLVVLVDAGDRRTGNAYVDMAATPGMPMIALMNRLGATWRRWATMSSTTGRRFWPHDRQHGVRGGVRQRDERHLHSFPQLPPYVVLDKDGIRIGFRSAW